MCHLFRTQKEAAVITHAVLWRELAGEDARVHGQSQWRRRHRLLEEDAILPHWSTVLMVASLRKVCGVEARMEAHDHKPEMVSSQQANELLTKAVERLPLSARGRARVARVARSAALLAGAEDVEPSHVAEALSFRSPTELGPR